MDEITGDAKDENAAPNTPENMQQLSGLERKQEPELKTGKPEENKKQIKDKESSDTNSLKNWFSKKAEKAGLHDWLMVVFTGVLTFVAASQLQISCSSSDQTDKLIAASQRNERAATRFATAAQGINSGIGQAVAKLNLQAEATKNLVGQAVIQANAATAAGEAAKSAATTAKGALHISERAYVVTGNPQWDFTKQTVTIPITNPGHVPSGKFEITIHSVTLEAVPPSTNKHSTSIAWTWTNRGFQTISPGGQLFMDAGFKKMSAEKMNTGDQGVLIVGYILYNDGFKDSPQQQWNFCWQSQYSPLTKATTFSVCDPSEWLSKVEKQDGYPNNKDVEQP